MKYTVHTERIVFDDFFTIKKANVTFDSFSGNEITADRLCFERGDSVAILLHEKDTGHFLFTKQFRYPTIKHTNGWLLELVAGSLEENDLPENRVRKEVMEEIGYEVHQLDFISKSFVSPGGSSERIFLYYAEVSSTDKTAKGGGLEAEKEDIQLVKIDRKTMLEKFRNNEFQDAKTIMAIQWYLINELSN